MEKMDAKVTPVLRMLHGSIAEQLDSPSSTSKTTERLLERYRFSPGEAGKWISGRPIPPCCHKCGNTHESSDVSGPAPRRA